MSLLNLVHKNVVIKFANSANPEASHVFRLTGVDAMGFLRIQDLKPGGQETASEPYWINKDLVREIYELDLAKETLRANGETEQVRREATPKPAKTRAPRAAKIPT